VINLLQLHYVKEPRLYIIIIIALTREQEKGSSDSKYNKLKHYHDEKKKPYIRQLRHRPQSFHIKLRSRYSTISNCEAMLEAPLVILVHPPAVRLLRLLQGVSVQQVS